MLLLVACNVLRVADHFFGRLRDQVPVAKRHPGPLRRKTQGPRGITYFFFAAFLTAFLAAFLAGFFAALVLRAVAVFAFAVV
jgi:hypothetical protein